MKHDISPYPESETVLFIIGSGRSGTTLLYNLISTHPDVCWFSTLTDAYPNNPWLSLTHRMIDMPIIGRRLQLKTLAASSQPSWSTPNEGGHIYHDLCGFPFKQKSSSLHTNDIKLQKFYHIIDIHKICTGHKYFLSKQTSNTQRLNIMRAAFPNAYWIHIIRDGRAVANSLCNVNWWPTVQLWWLGKTPSEWNPDGTKWLELSAKHWQKNVMEIQSNALYLKPKYLEVHYEHLVQHPRKTIESIIRFAKLTPDESYLHSLPEFLPDNNIKWRKSLSTKNKQLLHNIIGPYLQSLGYST